jgi:dephospho-CoA kinase
MSKPVIGIVGGIGAGKSTVAAELAALGCEIIDADRIGHELLKEPAVMDEIRKRWGEAAFSPDGSVNRSAVAKIVFEDVEELSALNAILHPRLRERIESRIAEITNKPDIPAVILDAAVLFEAGWNTLCTDIIFVSSPVKKRQQRARQGKGWDERSWATREKSQISLDKKLGMCNYTVDNSSDVSHLREQVRKLIFRVIRATEPS